ncbi:MAG: stage III sporulation protein SpoIIIAB [Bacillota bacterium]|nr:stage III sporulation protein SpoIIIAB [Bacillota bacterium]
MLLKLLGGLIVISASCLMGYAFARDCARRPKELRLLQVLLQMLENEISFLSNLLTDSMDKISYGHNGGVYDIFRGAANNLRKDEGHNAFEAWEMSVKNNIYKTGLNKEDEEILLSFGKMLGSSDVEGQLKNIKLTVNQLKVQEKKAEEARQKNEKMYKSLGFLGGLAVVIILI